MAFALNRKLWRNLQDYGLRATLHKGAAYVVNPVWSTRVYRIYRKDLSDASPGEAPEVPGLTFRILTPEDHDAIGQIEERHEWLRGQLKAKLEAGGLCLAAFAGDTLAGFNLIGFGSVRIPLLEMTRRFRPGDAWSEHIAVEKDRRHTGLASHLRHRIFAELRQRGYRRLYGGTLRSNVASLGLARKVGCREIVDIRHLRLLGQGTWRYRRVTR